MELANRSFDESDFQVLRALNDEDYEFRTIDGLADETGLSREEIRRIITKNPELIGRSEENDSRDRPLYYIHDLGLIVLALSDSGYDFRTIGGIAGETGIGEREIRKIIKKNPDFIQKANLKTRQGDDLYYLNTPSNSKKNFNSLMK